ncbi:hypothetical protein BVRB_6g143270 [Beta vulgaris subsp. vulgaris]|nr:hypothetical protein BVRB_6g143270 [Beta vulgaris subsp. vulgaris]
MISVHFYILGIEMERYKIQDTPNAYSLYEIHTSHQC